MDYDSNLAHVLRGLACGELEPEEWLRWWNQNSEWVATLLNRGQFLRLKPRTGGSDSADGHAWGSQTGACKLLDQWGVEYEFSDRYQKAWDAHFKEFRASEATRRKERQKRFRPILKSLEAGFPRFVRFPRRDSDVIERMDGAASEQQVSDIESSLGMELPESYKRFLRCSESVELGDTLKVGLPHTFIHESPPETQLPTHGMLCFGECWLEADGDQVLFGDTGSNPPVFYYAHEASSPEVRQVAETFAAWIEAIPSWNVWES